MTGSKSVRMLVMPFCLMVLNSCSIAQEVAMWVGMGVVVVVVGDGCCLLGRLTRLIQ